MNELAMNLKMNEIEGRTFLADGGGADGHEGEAGGAVRPQQVAAEAARQSRARRHRWPSQNKRKTLNINNNTARDVPWTRPLQLGSRS